MGNMIDYVKNMGNFDFTEVPFQTEDALVFSELCYLKFDGIVEGQNGKSVSLSEIDRLPEKEKLFCIKAYEKDNRALFKALTESMRFKNLTLSDYVNYVDRESETQFSAIMFTVSDDVHFIAFRGTDETMCGWQEDFKLALKKPIIGQTLSTAYINTIAERIRVPFFIGGHSKGGNLAMYAAMCASDLAKNLITKIYSFDGPGFRPEFLDEMEAGDFKSKLVSVIPKSSPVGMLLNSPGEYTVIEAKSVGVLQHNPYNWVINKDNKLSESSMTEQHKMFMKSMNEFILSLDEESLSKLTLLLCGALDATNASTTEEFKANAGKHTKALIEAGKALDDESKEMAQKFLKTYTEIAGDMIKENFQNWYNSVVESFKSR